MSNSKKNKVTRSEIRRTLRCLELDARMSHVVLIKANSPMADKKTIERFANAMAHSDISGVVCVVENFDDLSVINEIEMAKLGWEKVDATSHQEDDSETHPQNQDLSVAQ